MMTSALAAALQDAQMQHTLVFVYDIQKHSNRYVTCCQDTPNPNP